MAIDIAALVKGINEHLLVDFTSFSRILAFTKTPLIAILVIDTIEYDGSGYDESGTFFGEVGSGSIDGRFIEMVMILLHHAASEVALQALARIDRLEVVIDMELLGGRERRGISFPLVGELLTKIDDYWIRQLLADFSLNNKTSEHLSGLHFENFGRGNIEVTDTIN
jgi:hypothetical protein